MAPPIALVDLVGEDRSSALPVLIDSFSGVYRWHAKRTLRTVSRVRGALRDGAVVGLSMLERLLPEVGYVYYIAVGPLARRSGLGGRLLDDALTIFRDSGAEVVYAAVEDDNVASIRLFTSRGFRATDKHETGYAEGGLGAWGLRSRMWVVRGETVLGVRLAPPGTHRRSGATLEAPPSAARDRGDFR